MSDTRVIAVINQKGGVGKTTVTTNTSHGLARRGKKVLAIDLDPQGQLTSSLGVNDRDIEGIEYCLLGELELADILYEARASLDLAPVGAGLIDIERLTEGGAARGRMLSEALSGRISDYDYVLIDCPPTSGLLVVNALFATQEVLIPMTGDYLGLQGLAHLTATLKNFEAALHREYTKWIVFSRFVPRRRLSNDVKAKLLGHFPDRVLATDISESVTLAECPGFGRTIFEYSGKSRSAQEYASLVDDLIEGRVQS